MTNTDYRTRFHRFQTNRERYFAPQIKQALKAQYQTVIDNIHLGPSAVLKITAGGMQAVIRNLYMDAGIIYGAKVRADFNKEGAYAIVNSQKSMVKGERKSRGAIGFSERMAQLIADYFRTDILNTSEGITQTTRDLITKIFTTYYAEGLGIDDIVKALANTELSVIRSRMIARTETVTAANKGALFVATETGLKLNKTWLAAHDKRTRLTHSDHGGIDGKTIGKDDYFTVGGEEMLIPGDRGGHDGHRPVDPSLYINCRCTVTFKTLRDSAGKLIRA